MMNTQSRGTAVPTSDLTSTDYEEMYDLKEEYVSRRNPDSFEAKRIKLEVVEFKIPNLIAALSTAVDYQTVIEIGCATGDLLAAFPERHAGSTRKIGFDISPLNVSAARQRYPDIEFLSSDFRSYSGQADIVILSDILEHVPEDVDFLKQASQLGTIVVINLPLEDNWLNARRKYGVDDDSGHLRAYSLQSGLKLVAAAGLEVLNWRRVWPHETGYDVKRRALRKEILGSAYSGNVAAGALKGIVHFAARKLRPFGRRLYPSNLFVAAKSGA